MKTILTQMKSCKNLILHSFWLIENRLTMRKPFTVWNYICICLISINRYNWFPRINIDDSNCVAYSFQSAKFHSSKVWNWISKQSFYEEINPLNLNASATHLFMRATQKKRVAFPTALFIHDRSVRLDYVRAIVSKAHFDKQLMGKRSRKDPERRARRNELQGLTLYEPIVSKKIKVQ